MSLPSGYTQLEYIEGSGSQYIDTKLICNKSDSWRYCIVADLANNSNYAGCNGYLQYQASIGGGVKSDIDIVYQNVTETISVNGVQKSSQNWAGYSGSNVKIGILKLGDVNNAWAGTSPQSGKIYSCKIYKSGVLTRDFVPCKNSSGVVGMWDDVNSQFYTNAGTGVFTAGPPIVVLPEHKTLVGGTAYEVKGGKCLVNGTVYSIKKGRTLVNGTGYDITFAPSYDPVFANNTWEQIIEACHNKEVPDTWKVADHKPMTINGASYQVDIIGKNHDTYANGGKAPLTFQLHDCYGETKNMNSSDTNNGGWTSCAMRSTHLPAILAMMPTEVQNGIREVNKLTSAGSQSTTINTTADKLFLLSEIEIFGSVSYSKSGEGTQYDYYKAGNSKVKNYNGIAYVWWERSPFSSNFANFCHIYGNGVAGSYYASGAYGVAFAFCL